MMNKLWRCQTKKGVMDAEEDVPVLVGMEEKEKQDN